MRSKNASVMEEIVHYIDSYYLENSKVPSVREIAEHIGMSISSAHRYLTELNEKGLITMEGGWRGISTNQIEMMARNKNNVAIVGEIACGTPLFAQENITGYVSLPVELFGQGKFFILKAKGDSMINIDICDGDYVLVRQQNCALEGQVVVALVNGEDATLKRFYIDKKKHMVKLVPENDNMEPMYYEDVQIQGVVLDVIKPIS